MARAVCSTPAPSSASNAAGARVLTARRRRSRGADSMRRPKDCMQLPPRAERSTYSAEGTRTDEHFWFYLKSQQ
eukprot:5230771-Pleurochrysis_carterae.AAC.1